MQIMFAFTFNPETKESTWVGNVDPTFALQILSGIAVADGVQKAKEADVLAEPEKIKTGEK